MSLSTLKKHSTSSVVEDRGCSGGMLLSTLNCRLHSLLSMSTIKADRVSRVKPLTLLTPLQLILSFNFNKTLKCHFLINFKQAKIPQIVFGVPWHEVI